MYGKTMVSVMNRPPQLALWQKSSLPPSQLYDTKPRGSYMTVQVWGTLKQFLNLLLTCIYFFFKSIRQIVWSSVPGGTLRAAGPQGLLQGSPCPSQEQLWAPGQSQPQALGTSPGALSGPGSAAWTRGSIPPQACTHGTAGLSMGQLYLS